MHSPPSFLLVNEVVHVATSGWFSQVMLLFLKCSLLRGEFACILTNKVTFMKEPSGEDTLSLVCGVSYLQYQEHEY